MDEDDYQAVALVSRSFTANILEVDRGIQMNVTNDVACGNLKYSGLRGTNTADAILERLDRKLAAAQEKLDQELEMERFTEQQCNRKQELLLGRLLTSILIQNMQFSHVK